MNALRRELRQALDDCATGRPAALRRSLTDDALYATDLPEAGGEAASAMFTRMAEAAGWTVRREGKWLLLDRVPDRPPEGWCHGPRGPEAACCAGLVRRERKPFRPPAEKTVRERNIRWLIKAAEKGPEALEKTCADLHQEWAAGLREGREIPEIDPAYFEEGI